MSKPNEIPDLGVPVHGSPVSFDTIQRILNDGNKILLPNLSHLIQNISPRPFYEKSSASVFIGYYKKEKVALKVLKAKVLQGEDEKVRRRTWREMNIWFQLNHENVIPLYGYDETFRRNTAAIVYPWCQNGHARHYIKTQKPPIDLRLALLADISDGLAYMHKVNIVHGDLKPENILINDNGTGWLADFGMSHAVNESDEDSDGQVLFYPPTARYCAPELFTLEGPTTTSTKESDVYALGSTAVELAFGILPYSWASTFLQVVAAVSNGMKPAELPPHDSMSPGDASVWELIDRCWRPLPGQRPSASEFAMEIRICRESKS